MEVELGNMLFEVSVNHNAGTIWSISSGGSVHNVTLGSQPSGFFFVLKGLLQGKDIPLDFPSQIVKEKVKMGFTYFANVPVDVGEASELFGGSLGLNIVGSLRLGLLAVGVRGSLLRRLGFGRVGVGQR